MRTCAPVVVVVALLGWLRAPARADDELYLEYGAGVSRGARAQGDLHGDLAARAAVGASRGAWGAATLATVASLGDRRDDGSFDRDTSRALLTIGPVATARAVLSGDPRQIAHEVYGGLGPTYTWTHGGPDGALDGMAGPGFTAEAGLRWVFADRVVASALLTWTHARVHRDAGWDPAREAAASSLDTDTVILTVGLGYTRSP